MKKKVAELRDLVADLGLKNTGFLELADYVKAILEEQKRKK